ncbi:MAG: S-methyl-5-thioribose-1-phosphate isomerase [Nitrospirae bacterium]|nr:S-methyl-5-thioribose-1-phosphate isomerase [Nitrospirota bacterium]
MTAARHRPLRIIDFTGRAVRILDQRLLPGRIRVLNCRTVEDVARAIETLAVRGAPAIGVAGAYGVALALTTAAPGNVRKTRDRVRRAIDRLSRTRPTARNLFWAMEALRRRTDESEATNGADLRETILAEVRRLVDMEAEANRRIGLVGVDLVPSPARALTICNTGPLATGSYGTALGVLIEAARRGKNLHVFACETRPLFQGARLTCWELQRARIPATLLIDSAAAWLLKRERVDFVIVGADRIAANGDTANKIGTYALACSAREAGVPFYVAAPSTTFDLSLSSGENIPIEQRDPGEVENAGGRRVAPPRVRVWNPAFDVTPATHISAIVTDRGILRPPFESAIRAALTD